uniref:Uncharacterized protein n=1 Tax=Ignisphaera aggregans TaxID=334771 RepID=A0A7C4FFK0_9CREN
MWHIERMGRHVIAQYKVVWRDVASEFVPAAETTGAISYHNVHYVVVSNLDEACYIMTESLAPQINAVVGKLSPWIRYVQPRFIRYFKIPRYSPNRKTHKQLVSVGLRVSARRKLQRRT